MAQNRRRFSDRSTVRRALCGARRWVRGRPHRTAAQCVRVLPRVGSEAAQDRVVAERALQARMARYLRTHTAQSVGWLSHGPSSLLSRACLGKRSSLNFQKTKKTNGKQNARVSHWVCVVGSEGKRHFFEFSLCLSRACLGKIMHFIYKWRKKCRFLA
jgi:hypothetical protein